jgi:hypothetical protein
MNRINYDSGSDILTSYASGSGSANQKVTVPVPHAGHDEMLCRTFLELSEVFSRSVPF